MEGQRDAEEQNGAIFTLSFSLPEWPGSLPPSPLNYGNHIVFPITASELVFPITASEPKNPDFLCDNNLRVSTELECDGNNNCGDNSDESDTMCIPWPLWKIVAVATIGGFPFCVLLVIVIAAIKRVK
jgi:hypothetical protein